PALVLGMRRVARRRPLGGRLGRVRRRGRAGERGVDRRDVGLAARRLGDRRLERAAVAGLDPVGDPAAPGGAPEPPGGEAAGGAWEGGAGGGLGGTVRPVLWTAAMASGVLWKKRMKRTSAARCGSVPSSRARLSTRVREAPGAPSAAKATL